MSTNKNKKGTLFAGNASTRMAGTKSKRSMPPASIGSESRMRKTIYGGASRTAMSSASRRNAPLGPGSEKMGSVARAPVQVFDEEGQDVTPQPLLQLDPNIVRKNQSNILADSSGGTPTDLMSQASIYQTGTVTASTFGGGPFTRSVFSASQSGRSTGSITDDIGEPTSDHAPALGEIKHKREEVAEDLSECDLNKIVEIDLTETETIWLLDMPGVCVGADSDEASLVAEQNERYNEEWDSREQRKEHEEFAHDIVRTMAQPAAHGAWTGRVMKPLKNKMLVKSRVGNDRYAERGMNTFNEPPKLKSIQTIKITHTDTGVNASNWDMFDTYEDVAAREAAAKAEEDEEGEGKDAVDASLSRPGSGAPEAAAEGEKSAGVTREGTQVSIARSAIAEIPEGTTESEVAHKGTDVAKESRATAGSSVAGTDSVFASKEVGVSTVTGNEGLSDEEVIMNSESLKKNLVIMERVVNLNNYQPKQALYRSLHIVEDIDKVQDEDDKPVKVTSADMGPNLDRLWVYSCPLSKSNNVSCMAWNKSNEDLMAVGYGQFEFTGQKGGMVCCWSLKNPEYPERVYTCSSGVTSMDFSVAHPNLLAVGLYDGTVAIYNVRSRANETVLDSFESSGKHTGPVWQLKWIEKERGMGDERAEVLVSISQDGRVTQWSIRKGFESYDLMKLKRVAAKQGAGKAKKGEAFISRYAGGLCFDFSSKDPNIYLAGTEEGHIHKCSCSYKEQYLDSYLSHTGPVYAIQWCPFNPDVFLSCSGDWTLKLWHQDRLKPILHFHSSTKAVPDICWSPRSSTVFATVNEGAIEVWDLSQNTLDPIIELTPMAGIKLSTIVFARNSDCLLVGDSEGQVTVYQLRGMPVASRSKEDQADNLNKIIQTSLASQLQK